MRKHFYHFNAANWWKLLSYIFDFKWNDCCFGGRGILKCAVFITEVVLSLKWRLTFRKFFLQLTNLGLTLIVVALFPTVMLSSRIIVVFKLLKLMRHIHLRLAQNLFFVTPKTFSLKTAIIFLVPLPHSLLHCAKNVNSNFSSYSFPSLVTSDNTTNVIRSKAELFT